MNSPRTLTKIPSPNHDLAAQLSQRARQLADTRYTYEAYLDRTREAIEPIACAAAEGART